MPDYEEEQKLLDSVIHPPQNEDLRFVYIDQLLQMKTRDDGSVQPELTLFVRIAKEKTKLKVSEKKKAGIFQGVVQKSYGLTK